MQNAINAVIRQFNKHPELSDFRAYADEYYAEAEPYTNIKTGREFLLIETWCGPDLVGITEYWKI